jgi:dTDP-glucose 4,6-dehydratase
MEKSPSGQLPPDSLGRILVTGAGGFIGSHLVERCLALGHEVVGFVRYNSSNSYPWIEQLRNQPRFHLHRGDIRDADSVTQAVAGCDTVLHLAALIGIPYSYESPLAYIRTNDEGTYNVLQAARMAGCRNIVVTSTSETYGTAQYVPMDERHPAVGQSPYAATKIGADQLALSFHRSFKLPVKVIRPFNTFGPRQSARAIIPTIISQILAGRTQVSLGNTTPTRDLTYVGDTVDGFLAVASAPACIGEVVNLGTQSEISMGDLALRIAGLMGARLAISTETDRLRPRDSEVERLFSNNGKVRALAGWQPRQTLDQGLRHTIDWMRENRSHYAVENYVT